MSVSHWESLTVAFWLRGYFFSFRPSSPGVFIFGGTSHPNPIIVIIIIGLMAGQKDRQYDSQGANRRRTPTFLIRAKKNGN